MCVWPSPLRSFCDVGRGGLVSHSQLLSHQLLVFLAALVVEDMEVYKEVLVFQSLHNDVVSVEAVDIFWDVKG